jgi:MraZ protein
MLDRYERQLDDGSPFSRDDADLSLLIHGGGIFMKLDGEGRLTMNDFIRDYTGITDQVTFVGRSDHFQLWEPARYEEARQEALRRRLAGGRAGAGNGEAG